MREIKFRAWDKNGEYTRNGKPGMLLDITGRSFFDAVWHEEEFEKMQYTGLKDKNGVEIYEGDLCRKRNGTIYQVYWETDIMGYAVKVIKSAAYVPENASLHTGCKFPLKSYKQYDLCILEIIGNIYENSELLGGR